MSFSQKSNKEATGDMPDTSSNLNGNDNGIELQPTGLSQGQTAQQPTSPSHSHTPSNPNGNSPSGEGISPSPGDGQGGGTSGGTSAGEDQQANARWALAVSLMDYAAQRAKVLKWLRRLERLRRLKTAALEKLGQLFDENRQSRAMLLCLLIVATITPVLQYVTADLPSTRAALESAREGKIQANAAEWANYNTWVHETCPNEIAKNLTTPQCLAAINESVPAPHKPNAYKSNDFTHQLAKRFIPLVNTSELLAIAFGTTNRYCAINPSTVGQEYPGDAPSSHRGFNTCSRAIQDYHDGDFTATVPYSLKTQHPVKRRSLRQLYASKRVPIPDPSAFGLFWPTNVAESIFNRPQTYSIVCMVLFYVHALRIWLLPVYDLIARGKSYGISTRRRIFLLLRIICYFPMVLYQVFAFAVLGVCIWSLTKWLALDHLFQHCGTFEKFSGYEAPARCTVISSYFGGLTVDGLIQVFSLWQGYITCETDQSITWYWGVAIFASIAIHGYYTARVYQELFGGGNSFSYHIIEDYDVKRVSLGSAEAGDGPAKIDLIDLR